jgi:hypothetical protein
MSREERKREARLITQYRSQWLGGLARAITVLELECGFVSSAHVHSLDDDLAALPEWSTLRALTFNTWMEVEKIATLLAQPALRSLRAIHDLRASDVATLGRRALLTAIERLTLVSAEGEPLSGLPRLHTLKLTPSNGLFSFEVPLLSQLRSLTIHCWEVARVAPWIAQLHHIGESLEELIYETSWLEMRWTAGERRLSHLVIRIRAHVHINSLPAFARLVVVALPRDAITRCVIVGDEAQLNPGGRAELQQMAEQQIDLKRIEFERERK